MFLNNKKGQSLLEVMIAIGIMTFGIIAIVSLLITTSVLGRKNSKELVATQLAREGLEVVHNIRDNNWLSIEDGSTTINWNTGLVSPTDPDTDFTAVALFNPSTAIWTLNFLTNNISDPGAIIYLDSNNIYRHKLGAESISATTYNRILTFTRIFDGPEIIGYTVKCQVRWHDGGNYNSKILEENIYDWKAR